MDDITKHELAMYRDRMLSNPSPHTGAPYKRTTINGRVGTVCRFYQYMFAQGLINELLFSYKQVIAPHSHGANSFAHTDRNAGIVTANNLLLKTPTPEIRAIAIPDLRRILQNWDQRASETQAIQGKAVIGSWVKLRLHLACDDLR